MMKTRNKALLLTLCAVLLVAASVLGTMAYLTSKDQVVNTFTVGNVKITLDETDVDINGVKDGETRVQANSYKLMPGHSYIKDPTIHVDTNSEDCWLFVKVENGIAAIEDSTNTIAAQMAAKGWTLVTGTNNIYCRATTNKAGDNVVVFENFKIDGAKAVTGYETAKIIVTAYAVQADGFTTAEAAWTAAGLN